MSYEELIEEIGEASPADTQAWLDTHPEEAEVLARFVVRMADELAANDGKGNRPGWLTMGRREAIGEVHWHAAKLAVAAKEATKNAQGAQLVNQRQAERDVREYAADVANCALMVLDVLGLAGVPHPPSLISSPPPELAPHIHHGRESL